ncbi:ATP-binding cassette domain-containing protein [Paenibacillus sp. P3E]|uniref:ATP-binding cassette domain-containing protein n=1 Tax=Paenibacillus sp. P3E TaxID=1349435 RepID=UPI0015C16655|nr:ATP-binding cassette domain-containing protein [Paenibacillus sp. P3E]
MSKRYKSDAEPAVCDFNLSVDEGELIVLTGPGGSEKSTTLGMLAGLEKISSGELYIGGKYVNYAAPKDREVAIVMPSSALYPNMTIFEIW